MKSGETPKTMPSTAENQNESEKVKASAPTAPAPMMAMVFSRLTGSPFVTSSFVARRVMVQKRNRMVNPLLIAESRLTCTAACGSPTAALIFPPKSIINSRPSRIKSGAPGGWDISSRYAQGMNSPQSQKLAVASRVRIKTVQAIAQTIHPDMLLTFLKFMRKNYERNG